MRDNLDAFVREDRWRFFYSPDATGGTLGPHFEFLADDSAYRMEQAYIVHLWARFGYRIMAPRATLRSRPVVNPRTANCWEYNPIHNELNLSIYELTERTLPIYVAACAKFQPRFIHGYPSALVILARLLLSHEDQKARFPKLVAVLGASEGLLPGQRELIEGTFGCRLVTWYGQTERVILAGECEGSNLYHCTPQYGITELIDDQGRNITEPGVEGELVGTGFINRVMPFIRYRMRDYSSWVAGYCPHCRRPYPLLSGVRGRLHDYLIGRDGRHVPMMALVDAPEFASVERFQFYQDIPGRVELRLMIREGFGDGYVQRIRRVMEGKLGKAFELDLKLVNHIALSPRGKLNCIIQKLAQS
jgi:phenylacetate-CoA ligase